MEFWHVYILYRNGTPVYVGCTANIDQRMRNHKKNKNFDSYDIFYSNGIKQRCLNIEKTLINFVIDHYPECYNKQKRCFVPYKGLTKI